MSIGIAMTIDSITMKVNILLIILSLLFVSFSFFPSLYEIQQKNLIPKDRTFTPEHNYLFDYNFYLSRIREGQEGKWMVTEKYYNKPHPSSLFQIFYLYAGIIGGVFKLSPPFIYHSLRIILGFLLLFAAGNYAYSLFKNIKIQNPGRLSILSFLLLVILGSWPIIIKYGNFYRANTYMGFWSVMDSLQRITTIPHVLFGQLMLVIILWAFSNKSLKSLRLLIWGIVGLITGIVFPPTLIIVYTIFGILSFLEFVYKLPKSPKSLRLPISKEWLRESLLPRIIFILLSFPSFIYLQLMFKIQPWKALALFDIIHRMPLNIKEYLLALGPVLILGFLGMMAVFKKGERKLFPAASWVIAIFLLIKVFENFPQQSPLRFTEGLINVPLGILAAYFFHSVWIKLDKLGKFVKFGKTTITGMILVVIMTGLFVMFSMSGWLTDQVKWRREGTWKVAIGAELVYPITDFMDGVYFARDNIPKNSVILGYVTAGNFIPAYAGNYVYIGHANTPDEDTKELVASKFFRGQMKKNEAKEFLKEENISYIFFGPQERELGGVSDLKSVYPFINEIYSNKEVKIFKVNL